MSYIPSRPFYEPPNHYEVRYGAAVGDAGAQSPPAPRPMESYEKPKPKDPRTFIGWALKAFFE